MNDITTAELVAPDGIPAAEPAYALHGVSRRYGSGSAVVDALRGVDLTIRSGEFVVVAGASGSGKTTLLQLLGALDRPTSGNVFCLGRDMSTMSDGELSRLRRNTIGFVFQQFNLIGTLTARGNVEAALASAHVHGSQLRSRAAELLDRVGLAPRAEHLPSQLSGGEQQRVAIARALANHPSVLLADEPTGNLDSTTGEEILGLLRSLCAERGQTVVLITHDRALAAQAPRLIELKDGEIVADSASRRREVAPAER
jgi:putative ABC transport system ATP-binding protein